MSIFDDIKQQLQRPENIAYKNNRLMSESEALKQCKRIFESKLVKELKQKENQIKLQMGEGVSIKFDLIEIERVSSCPGCAPIRELVKEDLGKILSAIQQSIGWPKDKFHWVGPYGYGSDYKKPRYVEGFTVYLDI